ncbi:MAG: hypothetical protein OEY22_05260 [Candidatus Bathyarchaeota archaeon]|nr:hypothetical protein [Candidatus Bathyarchaeota archaeon]MDH5788656.1 hypothetical protein [Candidatus Bathyarchaeota archaeon]
MGLLLRRGGLTVGVPILVGAVLVCIGLLELPWGILAVAIGILMIACGIYQLNKRRETAQRKKNASKQD